MDNKEILQELSTMKDYLSNMYNSLDVIRANLPEDIKQGTNKARELIGKLTNTLDYQADLIIFSSRSDIKNIRATINKINNI